MEKTKKMEKMENMSMMCNDTMMPCGNECPKAGYAFVPVQVVTRYYDQESAMKCGTIFPELCIPKGKYGPNEDAQQ